METLDKAVSTEDFATEPRNVYVEAVKLEAILNALVEHKVESMKNRKSRVLSIQSSSSPKRLVSRLRIMSISSSSLKEKDYSDNSCQRLKYSPKKSNGHSKEMKKQIRINGNVTFYWTLIRLYSSLNLCRTQFKHYIFSLFINRG